MDDSTYNATPPTIDSFLLQPPGTYGYTMAAIGSIFLAGTLLGATFLIYITLRHGYGSKLLNMLVLNWALIAILYGISYHGLRVIRTRLLHKQWLFGHPSCAMNLFMEDVCVLPLDAIPTIICTLLYRQVFVDPTGRKEWLARTPSVIWGTLGLWAILALCVFGSVFTYGLHEHVWIDDLENPIECADTLRDDDIWIHRLIDACEIVFGSLIPLVVIIFIGVKMVKRIRVGEYGRVSSHQSKMKIPQVILALIMVMFVYYLWVFIEYSLHFNFAGVARRILAIMPFAVSLILILGHEEFIYSLPCKHQSALQGPVDDDILANVSFSKLQKEPKTDSDA